LINWYGIHFAVCSGRQFVSEQKLFAPIREELLYITNGGMVVQTPKEILQVSTMLDEVWKGMYQMVHENLPDCDCYISTPDIGYAENENSRILQNSGLSFAVSNSRDGNGSFPAAYALKYREFILH
jgi:hypothetical protein